MRYFFGKIRPIMFFINNIEQCLSSIVRKYIFSPSWSNLTTALKSLVYGKLIDRDDNMSLRSLESVLTKIMVKIYGVI